MYEISLHADASAITITAVTQHTLSKSGNNIFGWPYPKVRAIGVLVQLNLFINRQSRTLCTRSGRRMLGYRGCPGGGGLRMPDYDAVYSSI